MRAYSWVGAMLAAGALCLSCGDSAPPPLLDVDIFGWEAGTGFVPSLPTLSDAQTIRLKVTRPSTGEVLLSDTTPVLSRSLKLEDIPFGEGLRLEIEVLNSAAAVIGTGATPVFDFSESDPSRTLRIQVTSVNSFAPVGNIVVDRNTGERKFAPSQFDYRGKPADWQGRIGHATAVTSDGRLLVVGGGDPMASWNVSSLGSFRRLFADVQLFDPQTGYFADLAYDEVTGQLLADDRDKLFEPVVHHTVTALGNDRFLVAGGFVLRADTLRPSNTLQIIDLNAPAGSRVTRMTDASGASLVLQKARGAHSATFRPADSQVVIAGGFGPDGDDDVLGTFELVDVAQSRVSTAPMQLSAPRAQHRAVSMSDGRIVWLIGGRGPSTVLATTDTIELVAGGATEAKAAATMRRARLGPAVTTRSSAAGELLFVAGGYTDFDGNIDSTYEMSRLGREVFDGGSTWTLPAARGGATAITLPNTEDIVLIGGRNDGGDIHTNAVVMTLTDLTASPPFSTRSSSAWTSPRFGATVDPISNGRLLIVGGEGHINGSLVGFDAADIYNPLDAASPSVVIVE